MNDFRRFLRMIGRSFTRPANLWRWPVMLATRAPLGLLGLTLHWLAHRLMALADLMPGIVD